MTGTAEPQAADEARTYFQAMFTSRSAEELDLVARAKRFRERYSADRRFREALEAGEDAQALFDRHGVPLKAEDALPLWHVETWQRIKETDTLAEWPVAQAWTRWINDLLAHRDMLKAHGDHTGDRRFAAWRRREMLRADSELGARNMSITHPIVAYELSKGCSVGCWFCGISAESFDRALPYTQENEALWQGVLSVMADRFGSAAQTGFCYWATDPMDNPDYDRFITDHWKIVGWLPQTTTAAPLKDIDLTRRVIALFDQARCVINRFSITSLRQLDEVHAAFTPQELLAVEMVLQNKGALTHKAVAGRVLSRRKALREKGREPTATETKVDTGTIACVSGFLINMVERRVQLVSPCASSSRWPLGYRIYDQGRFGSPEEFAAQVERMIDDNMPEEMPADAVIALREDLRLVPEADDRVELANDVTKHTLAGFPFIRGMAEMIAEGGHTSGEIAARLVGDGGDVFAVSAVMQDFYNLGLIDWQRRQSRAA